MQILNDEFGVLRQLRKIILSIPSYWEAQIELCRAYSQGLFGGVSSTQACGYIKQVISSARPIFLEEQLKLQGCISHTVRYNVGG